MCRLLGIVSSEEARFTLVLRDAPRSLAALSREHPDGWGIAVHASGGWRLEKGIACASEDAEFHRHAHGSAGTTLVSHVRKKTVGPTSLANTHPFASGRWVFAHNGTIRDLAWVRAQVAPERLGALKGDTDSELFFALLLTRLEEAGAPVAAAVGGELVGGGVATPAELVDAVVARVTSEALGRAGFGAFNFLLADGEHLWAHRAGRSLFVLERGPRDDVVRERTSRESGATVETAWTPRRRALFVASEAMTNEPWREVEEGALLRVTRSPVPCAHMVRERGAV